VPREKQERVPCWFHKELLRELQGTYQVAVVGGDNKVALRPVKVGERVDTMWVIESGVQAGEMVVTEGLQKVRERLDCKDQAERSGNERQLSHVQFFINRPIVAMVIAILMVIVGAVTITGLPVALFPNIVRPRFKCWPLT